MPRLETDDDIYQAKLKYLGPPDYPLPFHLTYGQWGLFASLSGGLSLASYLVLQSWALAGVAVFAGMITTAVVSRWVNPDRPIRKVLATAVNDRHRTIMLPDVETGMQVTAGTVHFNRKLLP